MISADKAFIKQRQKQFHKYALPIFPIQLTSPVTIDGRVYQMVGQQTSNTFLFTNYIVIDDQRNQAPNRIQLQVYTWITTLQLAEHFCFYIHLLEAQKEALNVGSARTFLANYYARTGKSIETLLMQNDELLEALIELQEEIRKVAEASESQPIEQLDNFFEKWEKVCVIYERRIPDLISFRSFVSNDLEQNRLDPNGLDQLYEEALMTYELFYETIPIDPIHLQDINAFIELNSMVSHTDGLNQKENVLCKRERFSYMFFNQITYVISLFIGLVIIGTKGLSLLTISLIAMLLIISKAGQFIKKRQMIETVTSRVNEQRIQQMNKQQTIHEKYNQAYENNRLN